MRIASAVVVIIALAWIVVVSYVAVHFIEKFW
jgi:hypothetical protein